MLIAKEDYEGNQTDREATFEAWICERFNVTAAEITERGDVRIKQGGDDYGWGWLSAEQCSEILAELGYGDA
jgi:hypothetical protein